jgi:dTDP-4-dehydrorhamnose 3,5-epimerase
LDFHSYPGQKTLEYHEEDIAVQVTATAIPGVKLITPARHQDNRGFLSEVFNQRSLHAGGINDTFVQENHTYSNAAGTVRGLHYQAPPSPQAKLVRVLRGAIFDVAVDVRKSSATFGNHVGIELDTENWSQLYIPEGFAHGFCTLEPDTEVAYWASSYWDPVLDCGITWDDPDLDIPWPVEPASAVLSEKDRNLPLLRDLPPHFQ